MHLCLWFQQVNIAQVYFKADIHSNHQAKVQSSLYGKLNGIPLNAEGCFHRQGLDSCLYSFTPLLLSPPASSMSELPGVIDTCGKSSSLIKMGFLVQFFASAEKCNALFSARGSTPSELQVTRSVLVEVNERVWHCLASQAARRACAASRHDRSCTQIICDRCLAVEIADGSVFWAV